MLGPDVCDSPSAIFIQRVRNCIMLFWSITALTSYERNQSVFRVPTGIQTLMCRSFPSPSWTSWTRAYWTCQTSSVSVSPLRPWLILPSSLLSSCVHRCFLTLSHHCLDIVPSHICTVHSMTLTNLWVLGLQIAVYTKSSFGHIRVQSITPLAKSIRSLLGESDRKREGDIGENMSVNSEATGMYAM